MSSASSNPTEDELRERVTQFMQANFPQIKMHGGTAAIQNIDPEAGSVSIKLGGACSGCGISPMTIQALKSRLTKEIPEIDTVHADTGDESGGGMSPSFAGDTLDDDEDDEDAAAPF